MEIGFDKEIDALLRKARGGGAVAAPEAHLDADTIAAFAENALPSAARVVYMKHLADCGRCRRILADVASARVVEERAEAAAPVVAPLIEKAAPWYSGLFGRGGLAVAFGAILLLFGLGIVVVLIQRDDNASNASVAKVEEYDTSRASSSAPMNVAANTTAVEVNSNSVGNMILPSSNIATGNAVAATNGLTADKALPTPASRPDGFSAGVPPVDDKPADKDRYPESEPKLAESAPIALPSPPTVGATAARKTDEEAKKETEADDARMSKARNYDARTRDVPAPSAKSGPERSGPLQSQQMNKQAGELSVTRSVGGRSFNYRDGAWYDTAYRNQGTANYRRGTEEYIRLDSGLRSIADSIGGTVVLVWKGKAYKIQ